MIIFTDYPLTHFEFWGGASAVAKLLTVPELEQIEQCLSEIYPNGLSATQLNDIFWFEDDFIAKAIGFNDFEELWEDRRK